MELAQHFQQLDAILVEHTWLWRPQPFKEARPAWCTRLPELSERLLALSDTELARLTEDATGLNRLLAEHLPALSQLEDLSRLAERETSPLVDLGPHFASGIPGRKWQQVTAFAAALGQIQAPLLEWCGGKGHLGRLLAAQWHTPVLTLEHDAELCRQGEHMAQRSRVAQTFSCEDALASFAEQAVVGRHAVALHACGELHRTLVRHAIAVNAPALDIAPCCYHLLGDSTYTPFNDEARLQLGRDDLRLAVTETMTAVDREVRLRDQEMAWKLGFDLLRRQGTDGTGYRPIKPIDKSWLRYDFAGFCRALSEREGQPLPEGVDWPAAEAAGWQRQRDTMRLSLPRHAFRRAIELWLVLDLAIYLQRHGYEVTVGSFCHRTLSPRNILVSARRECAKGVSG